MSESSNGRAPILYCIVPVDLAKRVDLPLRRWFEEDFNVEVVIDRRNGDRRRSSRARSEHRCRSQRRRGLRVTEPTVEPLMLPPVARPYRCRLAFARLRSYDERKAPTSLAGRLAQSETNRAAFAELYLLRYEKTYTRLRLALGDEHDAEDLAHAVLLKIEAAMRNGSYDGQPFKRWTAQIERNALRNHLRAHRRLELADPNDVGRLAEREGAASEDELPGGWLNDPDVLQQFERLMLHERQILMLAYLGGLTNAEIAQVLDWTAASVRTVKCQALARLRSALAKPDPPPDETTRAEFGCSRIPVAGRNRWRQTARRPEFLGRGNVWRAATA